MNDLRPGFAFLGGIGMAQGIRRDQPSGECLGWLKSLALD